MRKLIKKGIYSLLIIICVVSIFGCINKQKKESNIIEQNGVAIVQVDDEYSTKEIEEEKNTGEVVNELPKSRTIIDSMGREVVIPYEINRIVDLGIDGTKMLIQLGEEDKIVGLTNRGLWTCNASTDKSSKIKWSIVAEVAPGLKNVESVGFSFREINVETIVKLKPDIIISFIQTKDKIQAIEEQTDIPVVCISNFYTIDYKALKLLGEIINKEKRADAIIQFCNDKLKPIEEVISQIQEKDKKKAFIIIPTASSDSELDTTSNYQPINLAGMVNVANISKAKKGNFGISKEQVAVWNPDIFLFNGRAMNGNSLNEKYINSILNDPLLDTTNAIKNRQVFTYPGFDYGWDIATAIIQVPYLAKLAYPSKFANLNVEELNNEILEYLYGKDNLYSTLEDTVKLYQW